jgi:hypothetical protein
MMSIQNSFLPSGAAMQRAQQKFFKKIMEGAVSVGNIVVLRKGLLY